MEHTFAAENAAGVNAVYTADKVSFAPESFVRNVSTDCEMLRRVRANLSLAEPMPVIASPNAFTASAHAGAGRWSR